jgi:DNA-binding CsgD family transcriptional regulator
MMRDPTAVLDLFVATEAARDAITLRGGAVGALARLLPCDHVLWGELDLRGMTPVAAVTSDQRPVDLAAFARHAPEHPLIARHVQTGDAGPLRLSDFTGQRALHRLGVYADFYRPLGVNYALCVALPMRGSTIVGIAFHRARRDFDDDEVAFLRRARPALAAAVRDAGEAASQDRLTRRESQVLRRVARGESNGEVGLALRISRRTVEKHLEHVYRKLGVAGRYEAIASVRSSSTRP